MDIKQLMSKQVRVGGFQTGKPVKTSINLLKKESNPRRVVFQLSLFSLFLVCLGIATKILVIDQLDVLSKQESAYQKQQNLLETLRKNNNVYNDVNAQYVHYGDGELTQEESARQDRAAIMETIDRYVNVSSGIQSITIQENTATLDIDRTTLSEVASVVSALDSSEIVSHVSPSTATNEETDGTVKATIVITFTSPAAETPAEEEDSGSLAGQMGNRKIQTETEGMYN